MKTSPISRTGFLLVTLPEASSIPVQFDFARVPFRDKGVHFMETKPEVCWQVPVRREWEDLGEEGTRTTITEFRK